MLSRNQIADIKAQAYLGVPSVLNNVCKVYPKTVREIVEMGVTNYQTKLEILLLTEIEICELIKNKTGDEISPDQIHTLSYLLASADVDDIFFLELQNIFTTFVQEEVILLPKISSVLVGPPNEKRLINESNYRDFQDILRIQNLREVAKPPPENESPAQRKMRLLREKVEAVKRKQAQKKGGSQSLVEMLEIAETYGIDVKNCTFYSFYKSLRRRQMKEKWDQDIQVICAGADSKKIKTQYWGETLDKD